MGLVTTLQFIWNHPMNEGSRLAALSRFVRWQFGVRVLGLDCLIPFGTRGVLVAGRGDAGATGNYYCGVHEFPDMPFVAHAMGRGELFLDVGANVGSYTVLAGAVCGAEVIACEPVPETVRKLRRNVGVNLLESRVTVMNVAIGDEPGVCRMTAGQDTMNHIVIGEPAVADIGATVEVEVRRIDDIVPAGRVRLMKLDVEGFEKQALAGARRLLAEPTLLAVLIELNGSGKRYGVEDAELDATLRAAGFSPASYDPLRRELRAIGTFHGRGNTLYVRDSEELRQRLREAEPLRAFGRAV